jgi:hypothetical protein
MRGVFHRCVGTMVPGPGEKRLQNGFGYALRAGTDAERLVSIPCPPFVQALNQDSSCKWTW